MLPLCLVITFMVMPGELDNNKFLVMCHNNAPLARAPPLTSARPCMEFHSLRPIFEHDFHPEIRSMFQRTTSYSALPDCALRPP